MLIFEALDDNEAILVEGFETFSAYHGYARTLQFGGHIQDTAPVCRPLRERIQFLE